MFLYIQILTYFQIQTFCKKIQVNILIILFSGTLEIEMWYGPQTYFSHLPVIQ